ncbi:hypothetical protein [Vibrio sp. 1288]|uniref:hypothetical protein n=1 Tax=Vibrio sp. 1288 TaxID=3074550 RepID=UPI00296765CC|nr:hypothetical protein [Vibrio sp. 1288]MDW3137702.1 hypothetical protein [Vibrio sp. 1288]
MNTFESDWEQLSDKLKKAAEATYRGLSVNLSVLETYGREGKLGDGLSKDLLDSLIDAVCAAEAITDTESKKSESISRLKNALILFFARLKLDIESGRELAPLLEDARSLVQKINGIDENYLTVHELGLLWDMSSKTVRGEVLSTVDVNQLEKRNKLVLVPVSLALSLSQKRRGFTAAEEEETEGMILVPVTINGEFFNHTCRNKKGFRIGPKGGEYLIEDIDFALAELRAMRPKAYWRRQNVNGNWGIVAAIRWELRSVVNVKGSL